MSQVPQFRILLAKVGLDGHDRGIKVVARGLRDAGCHVIYSGLWQSVAAVVQAVEDEDVDWLGISFLNGAHMTLVPQILSALRDRGLSHVGVILGGIIPEEDQAKLKSLGVATCFGPGTSMGTVVEFLKSGGEQQARTAWKADLHQLQARFVQGDRRAFSRLLTLAGEESHASFIEGMLASLPTRETAVIAITGPGGVGKSSLLREIAAYFARRGESVGILACDPQSPITGGALLGDRCRILSSDVHDRVFVRSISTSEGIGSIPFNLERMLGLMRNFTFDRVFIETAGAGQGDTAVRACADIVVFVVQPQTGDTLQWEKAGLIEVADIVVLNKCDLAGADQTLADLRDSVNVPVVATSTSQHRGVEELCSLLESESDKVWSRLTRNG